MNETFDKILRYLDTEDWYVSYNVICVNFDIPDTDRKYILTKLDSEGYIDISSTQDSLDIKISDEGRVFIHETSFSNEAKLEQTINKSFWRHRRFDISLKIAAFVLAILTAYFGYNSYTKDQTIGKQSVEISRLKQELSIVDESVEELHFFSDPMKKDTFIIHMTGESILASNIEFIIKSAIGDTIFYHRFKSQDLIGYGLIGIESPTIEEKENFILKRFYNFFNESNFISPAISKDEELDEEYFDVEYFNEIQNQTDCVSFYYLLGEEYMRRIVYLRKKKIVIEFWACC